MPVNLTTLALVFLARGIKKLIVFSLDIVLFPLTLWLAFTWRFNDL